MHRTDWIRAAVLGGVAALACSTPLTAQTILGRVLDASNDRPVSLAAVHLMDGGRNTIVVAMADSLGRYALTLPDSGSYLLVAQRFGYHDMESPLLSLSDARDYTLDLELRPEPLGLGEITVTVRNEQAIRWLTREFGINPSGLFGFRILQGERLATAKAKGRSKPTETLRWLYVPVAHGMECVSINTTPRAVRGGWRGPRPGTSDDPGSAPVGTVSIEALRSGAEEDSDGCGRLLLNDRVVPNEHLDGIDMATIAVIVTLPGVVRMYTYDFDWTFR